MKFWIVAMLLVAAIILAACTGGGLYNYMNNTTGRINIVQPNRSIQNTGVINATNRAANITNGTANASNVSNTIGGQQVTISQNNSGQSNATADASIMLTPVIDSDDESIKEFLGFFANASVTYIVYPENRSNQLNTTNDTTTGPLGAAAKSLQSILENNSRIIVVNSSFDISDINNSNAIFLGNACNNSAIASLLDTTTCSNLRANTVYITLKTLSNGNHQLFIMALDDMDVLRATNLIINGEIINTGYRGASSGSTQNSTIGNGTGGSDNSTGNSSI